MKKITILIFLLFLAYCAFAGTHNAEAKEWIGMAIIFAIEAIKWILALLDKILSSTITTNILLIFIWFCVGEINITRRIVQNFSNWYMGNEKWKEMSQ